MKGFTALAALALLTGVAGQAHADDGNIDKVNGAIEIQARQHAGTLSTVNGAIRLDNGAVVKTAHTVNGSIRSGDGVSTAGISTVNGAIQMGADNRVDGKVHAVNGSITLGHGTRVSGHVANVNGHIDIRGATLQDGLETTAGSIDIGRGSHVDGGLVVNKPSHGWFHFGHSQPPVVVIGPGAVVKGTLDFRREVKLYVSKDASIGPVKGARPIRFSGEHPQM